MLVGAFLQKLRLIAELSKERGNLVGVAPLGAEFRSGKGILVRHADRRICDGRKRMEPLFGAAPRIVFGVFTDVESDFRSGNGEFVTVVGELNRSRGDANDCTHQVTGQLLRHAEQ